MSATILVSRNAPSLLQDSILTALTAQKVLSVHSGAHLVSQHAGKQFREARLNEARQRQQCAKEALTASGTQVLKTLCSATLRLGFRSFASHKLHSFVSCNHEHLSHQNKDFKGKSW
jgi:hypothetical protein